jgi:hypothetical protein
MPAPATRNKLKSIVIPQLACQRVGEQLVAQPFYVTIDWFTTILPIAEISRFIGLFKS